MIKVLLLTFQKYHSLKQLQLLVVKQVSFLESILFAGHSQMTHKNNISTKYQEYFTFQNHLWTF